MPLTEEEKYIAEKKYLLLPKKMWNKFYFGLYLIKRLYSFPDKFYTFKIYGKNFVYCDEIKITFEDLRKIHMRGWECKYYDMDCKNELNDEKYHTSNETFIIRELYKAIKDLRYLL